METIHHYLHRAEVDDPVTEAVRYRARLLRHLGLHSEIFATHVAPELARAIRPVATYMEPESTPILFQAAGLPTAENQLPLPARRVVLTSSALDAEHELEARLGAWSGALGARLTAVISELAEAARRPKWRSAPPLFDGSRATRRTPVLPQIPVGRLLVLAPASMQHEARQIVRQAAGDFKLPIELRTVGLGQPDQPAELAGLFRRADALLWSAPEDPLLLPLLALAFELPIVAAPSLRARQLLGPAEDAMLSEWTPATAAAALAQLLGSAQRRRHTLARQRERREALEREQLAALTALVKELGALPHDVALPARKRPRIVIEGSFETSYSLDILNRGLARALERAEPGQVALFPTHGYGDYRPQAKDLEAHPDLVALWQRGRGDVRPDLVLRGMYPPRVADMRGRRNYFYFAWEEFNVPAEWIAEFNRRLDGVMVLSQFVRKALIDAGLRIPVFVIGCGIDQVLETPREPFHGPVGKGFKFLHVSSAFPRKGIDALLAAYAATFSDHDDVTLVLKTFPNPHHRIEQDLERLRAKPHAPKVVLINRDLPTGQLIDLYHRCDALVAPSRGEGFGLPMAEAMALGLPVITTRHGGVLDFTAPDSTWFIDFTFAEAQSHMGLFDSVWAEPDVESLSRALRQVKALAPHERQRATARARDLVTHEHTWDRVAERFQDAIADLERPRAQRRPLRLGWVTSWKDGGSVAANSERWLAQRPKSSVDLTLFVSSEATGAPEGATIVPCWKPGQADLADLEHAILAAGCELVVVQLAFSLFDPRGVSRLLRELQAREIGSVVFLRAMDGQPNALTEAASGLASSDRVLVHSVDDLNTLKALGLIANVALFPTAQELTEPLPSPLKLTAEQRDTWRAAHTWKAVGTRLWGLLDALRRPTRSMAARRFVANG